MREQRLVFGEDAELYDRARPSYPAKLIDDVVAVVGASATTLDVGCGTGKATTLLAARGLRGVGVEPHAEMAAIARRRGLDARRRGRALAMRQAGKVDDDLLAEQQAFYRARAPEI